MKDVIAKYIFCGIFILFAGCATKRVYYCDYELVYNKTKGIIREGKTFPKDGTEWEITKDSNVPSGATIQAKRPVGLEANFKIENKTKRNVNKVVVKVRMHTLLRPYDKEWQGQILDELSGYLPTCVCVPPVQHDSLRKRLKVK